MKNYYLCDIHHHTNNSFDGYIKKDFDINELVTKLNGDNVTSNVKLVCFTDHNYFNYDNYVTNYNCLKSHGILCLPGLEVNTTNKVHWVFIFNDMELYTTFENGKTKGKKLEEEINAFFEYDLSLDILKQAEQKQNNPIDIEKFVEIINSISLEFMAIPHFDKSNGGWYDKIKKDIKQLQLLEFYIKDNIVFGLESKQIKEKIKDNMKKTQSFINDYVTAYENLNEANGKQKERLEQEISRRQEHLKKIYRINECLESTSVIYGSDYHGSGNYDKTNLFIMKSELSFEGLKFALLDYNSRIMSIQKYQKCLKNNNYVIDNVKIIENGEEKTIEFGDGLNCIIGSRGSGKTYFLSMILGDTSSYTTINKSITLKEINFLNHGPQIKLTPVMFDYVAQKNGANKLIAMKSNIYDLLARAPYDNNEFESELNRYFKQKPNSKNEIKDVINLINKIIIEYNNLFNKKNSNLDLKFIDSYDEFFNNKTEIIEVYEMFNNFKNFLDTAISNKNDGKIKIESFREIYENYYVELTELFKIHEVSKFITDQEKETYLTLTKELFKKIDENSYQLINANLNNIFKVNSRAVNILQNLKSEASNSQRILTDSMNNVKTYISDIFTIMRKIKDYYSELDKYDFTNLIEENNYFYSQGENTLNVRINKTLNLKKLSTEQFREMFYNYNNFQENDIIEKMILSKDYGEYYFEHIHAKKDGRKNSYSLEVPNVKSDIYLTYDDSQEKNWIDLSPGQRADILLNIVLLNDSNKILIIDQPEDDLDNETIFRKIVKRIRELKLKRQIIVVTHNANMAITADCDYLIICESSPNGKYKIINDTMESTNEYEYNSINNDNFDEEKTALEIATEILDGGKEALKQRVKKIGYRNLFFE